MTASLVYRLAAGMLLLADLGSSPLTRGAEQPSRREEQMLVRVHRLHAEEGRDNPASYPPFTTLMDPAKVLTADLAAAHAHRWEIQLTFEELRDPLATST